MTGKSARRPLAAFRPRLVIMVRLPMLGRVKSRLAREVGAVEATRFYRVASRLLLMRLARQPFWETLIAVSPDGGVDSRRLPLGIGRLAQGSGDLGARMHRPMRALPPGPVCLVGSDIPAIGIEDVRRAFRVLGRHHAVFGPAVDGGFWLVGFRRRPCPPAPYDGVAWSSARTLDDVLRNVDGGTVGFTTRLGDVDDASDLARERGRFDRLIRPA